MAKLFNTIAKSYMDRTGGYTRVTRLERRRSDGSEMALLEWVNLAAVDRKKKAKPAEAATAKPDSPKPDAEKK